MDSNFPFSLPTESPAWGVVAQDLHSAPNFRAGPQSLAQCDCSREFVDSTPGNHS